MQFGSDLGIYSSISDRNPKSGFISYFETSAIFRNHFDEPLFRGDTMMNKISYSTQKLLAFRDYLLRERAISRTIHVLAGNSNDELENQQQTRYMLSAFHKLTRTNAYIKNTCPVHHGVEHFSSLFIYSPLKL